MSSYFVQRCRSLVGVAACAARLRGPGRIPRRLFRSFSLPAGQTRSVCCLSPSSLGACRINSSIPLSYKYRFPAASPFRFLRSATRIFKIEPETVYGPEAETTSNDTVGSTGQVDGQQGWELKYIHIDGVERLERYRPGGYHPVALGDTLKDGRYQIVDKLGHGGFSTTWIAKDKLASEYVAVKICISDSTVVSHETTIIRKLLQSNDERASMIRPILDEFVLSGPNGQHLCIVTPPARMSIAASKNATHQYNIFPLPTARAIIAQLAQVVAFCHAHGVVHGDLHTGNVLLPFAADDNIHTLSPEAFYKRFRDPDPEPVRSIEDDGSLPNPHPVGLPTHGVGASFLGCRPQDVMLSESAILLIDFGASYTPFSTLAEQRPECHFPFATPPEAHFASSEVSFPADVWALACTIWEVVGGSNPLFGSLFFPSKNNLRQDWVHVLGRMPDEWWAAWDGKFRRRLFTDDGVMRPDRQHEFSKCGSGLEARFEYLVQEPRREADMERFLDWEKGALLKMLGAMLAYKPADRITAEGVLSTDWMLRWGLPALADMKKLRKEKGLTGASKNQCSGLQEQ